MARKEKKYHFIYKTTNLLSGKYYIGMHSTDNLNDGYLGSGKYLKRSLKKYGKENFKIEKIKFFDDRHKLIEGEKVFVNQILLNEPMCMNLREGGSGTSLGTERSEETKKRMSEHSSKTYEERVGKKRAKEWSKRKSKSLKDYYEKNGVSDLTRTKLSESHKGQIAWNKDKKTGLIPWNKNKTGSMTGTGCGVKSGNIPWNKGQKTNLCWIFNENIKKTKQIPLTELNDFINLGWEKGRKIKW